MSVDPTRRLARLREIIPRVYDTRPEKSVIGAVLARVADQLAEMDEAQRRVMYDRWLPLATGTGGVGGERSALERLGAMIETPRLRQEAEEAYRARIGTTARALSGGMATPRALLSLALTALGTEPCPRMQARLAPGRAAEEPWAVTLARGMAPGTRRRCAGCAGGDGPCTETKPPLVEAFLAENPLTEVTFALDVAYWQAFSVESRSLATDRPVVRLSPLGNAALSNPAVQNRATGEIALFTGFVRPGETLVLSPAMAAEELRPFDSFEEQPHHPWTQGTGTGRAVLRSATGERDVSHRIFFLSGSRLDDLDTVFAGPAPQEAQAELGTRFAQMEQSARTPRLRPGTDTWRLLQFAQSESVFWSAVGKPPAGHDRESPPRFAAPDAVEGTRFALMDSAGTETGVEQARLLFDMLRRAEEAARTAPPGPPVARLELDWLVRPPATFRLGVLRSAQVEAAEAMGAIDLLRRDLDLARPAGVRALFDIREKPLPRDAVVPAEGTLDALVAVRLTEDATPGEAAPQVALHQAAREQHRTGTGRLLWDGRFDITRLDTTRLG
ncbi:MAG: hypothetical protein ACOYOH_00290 [Paracraurococcus sp.]